MIVKVELSDTKGWKWIAGIDSIESATRICENDTDKDYWETKISLYRNGICFDEVVYKRPLFEDRHEQIYLLNDEGETIERL